MVYFGVYGSYMYIQLRFEIVVCWNGGVYYQWDGSVWVCLVNIICVFGIGNIGWDINIFVNLGLMIQELLRCDCVMFSNL